jgi:hypothetical protein
LAAIARREDRGVAYSRLLPADGILHGWVGREQYLAPAKLCDVGIGGNANGAAGWHLKLYDPLTHWLGIEHSDSARVETVDTSGKPDIGYRFAGCCLNHGDMEVGGYRFLHDKPQLGRGWWECTLLRKAGRGLSQANDYDHAREEMTGSSKIHHVRPDA